MGKKVYVTESSSDLAYNSPLVSFSRSSNIHIGRARTFTTSLSGPRALQILRFGSVSRWSLRFVLPIGSPLPSPDPRDVVDVSHSPFCDAEVERNRRTSSFLSWGDWQVMAHRKGRMWGFSVFRSLMGSALCVAGLLCVTGIHSVM